MQTVSRKERVQALVFLVVGAAIIAAVCGFLIGVPLLKDTKQYFVRFHESVQGIDKGNQVKYRGVTKGRVKDLTINQDVDEIQIELEIDPDLRVTAATQARIAAQGVLGPYFIELYGTVRESEELPEGAVIRTDPSTMKTFVDKGTQTIEYLQAALKNLEQWTGPENEKKFTRMLDEASAMLITVNETATALRPELERFVRNYATVGEELAGTLAENREALRGLIAELRKTSAGLNRFIESGRLDQVANEASQTLESIRGDFNRSSTAFSRSIEEAKLGERLADAVASLERTEQNLAKLTNTLQTEVVGLTQRDLGPALASFREAMATLSELTRTLRDDPSLILFSRPRGEIQVPRPGYR